MDEKLCGYGCGQHAAYVVGKGRRPCCSRHYTQCPAFQQRRRATVTARGGYGFESPARREAARAQVLARYGVSNVGCLDTVKAKIKATNMEKFGVENPFASEEIKTKIASVMVERYGAANPSNVPQFQAARQRTFDTRFGGNPQKDPVVRERTRVTVEGRYGGPAPLCHPVVKAKARRTVVLRYGGDAPWHRDEARAKGRITSMERYGCPSPVESREGRNKAFRSAGRRKPFVFPSGAVVYLQGFEGEAMTLLLADGIAENDIFTGREVPVVPYTMTPAPGLTTRHRYYPDIYIKSMNLLVEVKSLWTFQRGKSLDGLGVGNEVYERNMAKAQAARCAGFNFKFMLKHDDGHWSTF